MNHEDQITWVTLTLEFPDDIGEMLEQVAQDAGLSLKCYWVRVLLQHLSKDASPEETDRRQQQLPAILRRNGFDDSAEL